MSKDLVDKDIPITISCGDKEVKTDLETLNKLNKKLAKELKQKKERRVI